MAQRILSDVAAERGIPAEVASAGLLPGGPPMPPETQEALSALGYGEPGLKGHRSRQVTDVDVTTSDLIVGMARDHVRELAVWRPETWDRTFTLKELVRRGEAVGGRRANEGLPSWLAKVGTDRDRQSLLGSSAADDVEDPIGGPPSTFERTAAQIRGLCVSLGTLLWP
jgi:protein-tyrosine phosphatase